MNGVVFVRTRHYYDSYTDFWRLVTAAKFQTCFIDEVDLSVDVTYIFTPMNGEILPHLQLQQSLPQPRRARVIWWNLERPEDNTLAASLDRLQGIINAVWVSDRTYALLDARFSYVPVAGHPEFGTRSHERLYDICHLAYLWGRRLDMIGALRGAIRIAPEAWGRAAQDQIVAKSHLMLNIHQYEEMNIVAPLRFAVAASYAIPIVSEPYADVESSELTIVRVTLSQMLSTIEKLLREPDRLYEVGAALYTRLCVVTNFEREVIQAAKVTL